MKRIDLKILFLFLWTTALALSLEPPITFAFNSMDEIFLHDAVQEQVFILEAAEVAMLKSRYKQIREFAHELVKTMGHLNKRVGKLSVESIPPGTRVELPAALTEEQLKDMHELEEAPSDKVDSTFLEKMVHAHESIANTYEREIKYGGERQIKDFAEEQIPMFKEQRSAAQQMLKKLPIAN